MLVKTIIACRQKVCRWWRPTKWHSLRRLNPVSRAFGYGRGMPVDRYYIEKFLQRHAADIHGRVMEVGSGDYTRRFGGRRVIASDVLHAVPGNASATIIGDLASGRGIPEAAFDCLVLTQVLPFVFDLHGVARTSLLALKPGGVLLATTSGISQISRYDMDRWGDYWRLTSASALRLFESVPGSPAKVDVNIYGNVLAAVALLHGVAAEEVNVNELDYVDPDYEVVVGIRVQKSFGEHGS